MTLNTFQDNNQGLKPYSLRDDFGDNRLTNRSGAEMHRHFDPQEIDVAGRMLGARYRPEWHVIDGGPTARNQRVEHSYGSDGHGRIATASQQRIGTFSLSFRWLTASTSPSPDALEMDFIAPASRGDADRWFARFDSGGGLSLRSESATGTRTHISSNYSVRQQERKLTVRRLPDARLSLSLDGITRGTVRDAFLPHPGAFALRFLKKGSSRIAITNVEVR